MAYNLENYRLPPSLREYLELSKSIQSKLNDTVLEGIEDNYLRFLKFYDFSEDEFGEITVDSLTRYRSVESFGFMLYQNLKEKMEWDIKGKTPSQQRTKSELEMLVESYKTQAFTQMQKYQKLLSRMEKKDYSFDFHHYRQFHLALGSYKAMSAFKQAFNLPDTSDHDLEELKIKAFFSELRDEEFFANHFLEANFIESHRDGSPASSV